MTKVQKLTEGEKAFNSDVRALAVSFRKSDGQNAERSRLVFRASERGFSVRAIAQKVAEARVRLDHTGVKLDNEFVVAESKLEGYRTSAQTIQFLLTAYRYVAESGINPEDDSALANAYTLAQRGGDTDKKSGNLNRKGELIAALKAEVASLPEPDRSARFIAGRREILRTLASGAKAPVSDSQEVVIATDAPAEPESEKVSTPAAPTGKDRRPMTEILSVLGYVAENASLYTNAELLALYETVGIVSSAVAAVVQDRTPAKV